MGGLLKTSNLEGKQTAIAFCDGNGNIVSYVEDKSGNVLGTFKYDPFGNVLSGESTVNKGFPFQFSSKFLDVETEFNYYGFRYYNPETGRWLSRDPIAEDGFMRSVHTSSHQLQRTAKPYLFNRNNPVNLIDPDGLWVVCCRSVRVETGEPGFYRYFRHCDIAKSADKCDPGSESFGIVRDRKNCTQCPLPNVETCLKENPYFSGTCIWGDNCQSNTLERLKKCCLKAPLWNPDFYAFGPLPPAPEQFF